VSTEYYNPPDAVASIPGSKRVYAGASREQPRVPRGYKLVAVMDRLVYKCAPDVTDSDEYKHFYDQYYAGQFVTMDLYLVPE